LQLDLADLRFSKLAPVPGLKRVLVFDEAPAELHDESNERLCNRPPQHDHSLKVVKDELQPRQPVRLIDGCFEALRVVFDPRLNEKKISRLASVY